MENVITHSIKSYSIICSQSTNVEQQLPDKCQHIAMRNLLVGALVQCSAQTGENAFHKQCGKQDREHKGGVLHSDRMVPREGGLEGHEGVIRQAMNRGGHLMQKLPPRDTVGTGRQRRVPGDLGGRVTIEDHGNTVMQSFVYRSSFGLLSLNQSCKHILNLNNLLNLCAFLWSKVLKHY